MARIITTDGKRSDRWIYIAFTLLLLVNELCGVKITNLSVPRWIQNGTAEEVILDCEYIVSDKDTNLVLKWFLNEDPNPLYQWIAELNKSFTTEKLEGRFDGDAQGQTDSPNTYSKHRSLKIKNPTIEFTGKYRCDIITMDNSDSAEGTMVVYAPPKDLTFTVSEEKSLDGINLTCEAEGVFPLPQLRVYQITPGEVHRKHLPAKKSLNQKFGVYDIRLLAEIEESELAQPGASYFECDLLIQGTDYVQKSRIQYLPGHDPTDDENDVSDPDGCSGLPKISLFVLLAISVGATFIA